MDSADDQNPSYWSEYTNLQRVKHELIRVYLGGWLPKLGTWAGRILYFDTHAGRGKHAGGQLGSPIVAIQTMLSHAYREQILKRSQIHFFLHERDATNLAALETEITGLGALPKNVEVHRSTGDSFAELDEIITALRASKSQMAPAFVFIDPYGFKVPGSVLQRLMEFPRVELFINVIWRELDMALKLARDGQAGHIKTMNMVFGGEGWRNINAATADERAEQAVDLFRSLTKSKWATYVRMLGDNKATRYLLLHLTNHDAGRELMKDCVWKICPDGGFYARKNDDPKQQILITPTPDFSALKEWVLERLAAGPLRWAELIEANLRNVWRTPHLNASLRELRDDKKIEAEGKFVPSANPVLRLKK